MMVIYLARTLTTPSKVIRNEIKVSTSAELSTFITPNSTVTFGISWMPQADTMSYKLFIELQDGTEKEYSTKGLKENSHRLQSRQATATDDREVPVDQRPTTGLRRHFFG